MCKKTLFALLFVASFFASSCVDKRYDLANKEISTDVKIEGNVVALPVGDLKSVMLDSLIDVNEIDMLEKDANGVYSIIVDSTFSVEESVDPITLKIAPFEYYSTVEFEEVSIEKVKIDKVNVPAEFSSPEIMIDDLNDSLPPLVSNVVQKFDIPGLAQMLEQLKGDNEPYSNEGVMYTIAPYQVNTEVQAVACSFEYKLPYEVETINDIKLGSKNDTLGTLIELAIVNPYVLEACDKKIDFTITFPEMFCLAKNNAADQADKYKISADGRTVTLKDFEPKGDKSMLSFYLTDIEGVEDFIDEHGVLSIDEVIEYDVNYRVEGDIELTREMDIKDFAFGVNLDVQLSLQDIAGKTRDVKVEFEPVNMNLNATFNNLEHIDTINYVEFDKSTSRIRFETTMEKEWLEAFQLTSGYVLRIAFPEQLEIAIENSRYDGMDNGGVEYDENEHAFYVNDLNLLVDSQWDLALSRLVLNEPVEGDSCTVDVNAEITFVNKDNSDESGFFYLAGLEMESMVVILDKLNNSAKEANFSMNEAELTITNAVVHTKEITSSLNTEANFSINEDIPSEIQRIESIGFKKDVAVTMTVEVAGLECFDANIDLDFDMFLPSFLALKAVDDSSGVKVNDGVLNVKTSYNPSMREPLVFELLCTGIDFMSGEFGLTGMLPKDSTDGKTYISYDKNVLIEGEASISDAEFQSTLLKNQISFSASFVIEEIDVKTFHGIYDASIDAVEETIDFDLGEGLEFLREEDNSITLADPQLELVLTNPVGIPVGVDLHIYGYDESGALIEESKIDTTLNILPAEYDKATGKLTAVETKLFLTTDTAKNKKDGFDNIEIKNLANLLKRIPHTINLNVNPVIKTEGVTHHVDIDEPIKLDGAYSVVVPFRFDNLQLCYNDTIDGLRSSIGETMEMFSNVSLGVKMDVVNTIPLSLSLNFIPLNENDEVIEGIEIDPLNINAGSGEALLDENGNINAGLASQKLSFTIKSKGGDISLLDKLAMTLDVVSDHTVGSAGLKGEQGMKMTNVVFEISGDIETDLGE